MSFELVPKEFDTIKLEPANKPTKIVYEKQGVVVRTLKLTYEGATENVEKVEAS